MEGKKNEVVKKRKGSKHDKTGCLTCRYRWGWYLPSCFRPRVNSFPRRKKCSDNSFPICGTCRRLNLECIREPVRQIVPALGSASSAGSHSPPITNVSLNWEPLRPHGGIDALTRRHIMRHYVSILTGLLSISQQHNSFLSGKHPLHKCFS